MQIFSGKDGICSLLAVNRCKNVIRVSLLLGWDERSQKDKPEERRNCGCRRERLFNRFKRRSDPYEAQSQKTGKVAKSGSPELRPRQSRRARRSCTASGGAHRAHREDRRSPDIVVATVRRKRTGHGGRRVEFDR